MTCRPGVGLLAGATVLVLLTGLAFVVPQSLTAAFVLAGALAVAAVWETWLLRRDAQSFTVDRVVPTVAARGRRVPVYLELTNGTDRVCDCTIRDGVPAAAQQPYFSTRQRLKPGVTELEYGVVMPSRGLHKFEGCWVRMVGRWALVETVRYFPLNAAVRVLPESLVPDDELKRQALDERQLLEQVRESRHRGEGTEFESLSEYREGDEMRRIDWRSSARASRLIVRRFQLEQHRDVMLLLDVGRLMGTVVGSGTKLDCAVDAALRIARVALQTGDRCGVGVFDSKVRGYLAPVAGVESHRILIDRLYDVKPAWVESNFAPMFATLQSRQRKRALIILLSDIMEAETTDRYRAALMSLSHRHEVLFAALRTPLLREVSIREIQEVQDAAEKAFAFRLMREREQTLHGLRRGGIHVVDVEPAQLTIPLLNAFLEVRQRTVV